MQTFTKMNTVMTQLKPITKAYTWFERGAYASKSAKAFLQNDFDPNQVKKIAVIRHAALGDQVITRPFLVELKKFFPHADVTFVGVSNYQYATPSELVDRVHFLHGKDKNSEISLTEKLRNIREIGEQDIIFDLAGTNRSYWAMALCKAKLKVGFPFKSYLQGLLYNVAILRTEFHAEVEIMLDMLRLFGHCPPARLDFAFPDHQVVYQAEKARIVYFNGASQARKTLPEAQMFSLIDEASKLYPEIEHVYLEGLSEHEKGDFLKPILDRTNVSVQQSISLDELAQYLAESTLVVSVDTGILNFAVATHTPTVGIFYATNPFRVMPRYEPIHHTVMNPNASIPSNAQILDKISGALSAGS